jgi:CBS-domain-containing membrane protein
MTSRVVTVGRHETIRVVANMMRGRTIGCMPVVDKDRLVGIVTVSDLLQLLGRGIERPAKQELQYGLGRLDWHRLDGSLDAETVQQFAEAHCRHEQIQSVQEVNAVE